MAQRPRPIDDSAGHAWIRSQAGQIHGAGIPSGPIGPGRLPLDEALTRPNIARVYDSWLGGKDNLAVDREVAERVAQAAPVVVAGVRANRAFVRRAVAFLAESGISQFIDLGSGLPTGDNVHEVAGRINPNAKVAYVDFDPVVLVHARALLADPARTIVVEGDVREPERILADKDLRAHLDFGRPVAVVMAAILHFVTDAEGPARIVAAFRDVMVPGSALVITHVAGDDDDGERDAGIREGADIYSESTAPFVVRSRAQVAQWFDGFVLVPPGLVDADAWRRNGNGKLTAPIVAGVGVLAGQSPGTDTAATGSGTGTGSETATGSGTGTAPLASRSPAGSEFGGRPERTPRSLDLTGLQGWRSCLIQV